MEQSDDAPTWLFDCHPSQDLDIDFRFAMRDRHVLDDNFKDTSFEQLCLRCELELGSHACECCAQSAEKKCETCLYANGFHTCAKEGNKQEVWRQGTLHNGKLDVEAYLWSLIRRAVPIEIVEERLTSLISEHSLLAEEKENWLRQAREMRRKHHTTNPCAGIAASTSGTTGDDNDTAMSMEELKSVLVEREGNMQKPVQSRKT